MGAGAVDSVLWSWGAYRDDRSRAGSLVILGRVEGFSVTKLDPLGAHVVELNPAMTMPVRSLAHEMCHVASRSPCHAEKGICAQSINSSTYPLPSQVELDYWNVRKP